MSAPDSKAKSGLKPPSRLARPSTTSKIPGSSTGASTASSRAQSPDGTKSIDNYIIGDRVFVGGTKPGVIAYLGETQFAAGDWAGVILDEPVGKNDGTVQGVRYFQCDANRGVFSRPSKLARHVINNGDGQMAPPPSTPAKSSSLKPKTSVTSKIDTGAARRESNASTKGTSSLPKKNGAISGSNISLSSAAMATVGAKHIKVGDRVIVSGSKHGTLKFIGPTEFAAGEWAGVELDEPMGKNDGAVAGKRYFDCKPNYGLFAPVHKVTKPNVVMATPDKKAAAKQRVSSARLSTSSIQSGLNMKSKDLSVSHESLNSIASATSTASRSRVRLGVASLQSPQHKQTTASRVAQARKAYAAVGGAGTTTALQKTLKEKEEHIEQLLRERELERSEVYRTTTQKDEGDSSDMVFELQEQMTKLQEDYDTLASDAEMKVSELTITLETLQEEKTALETSLTEQKAKVEDLQFQMEEEAISRNDEQSSKEAQIKSSLTELKTELSEEKSSKLSLEMEKRNLQDELDLSKESLKEAEAKNQTLGESIKGFENIINEMKTQLQAQKDAHAASSGQSAELTAVLQGKDSQISELKSQLKSTEEKLSTLNTEHDQINTSKQQAETRLTETLKEKESIESKLAQANTEVESLTNEKGQLRTEINNVQLQTSDVQRQLETMEKSKETIQSDKTSLEKQISELMKNSGDSSQQLTMLNDQIREKDRVLEDLQTKLNASEQSTDRLQQMLDQKTKEFQTSFDEKNQKHQKDITELQENSKELQAKKASLEGQLDELNQKLANQKKEWAEKLESVQSDFSGRLEQAQDELASSKTETGTLKKRLVTEGEKIQELQVQLTASQQNVSKGREDLTAIKTQLDTLLSTHKNTLNELQELTTSQTEYQQQIQTFTTQIEELKIEHAAVLGSKLIELETLQKSSFEFESSLQEKTLRLDTLCEQLAKQTELVETQKSEHETRLTELKKKSDDKIFTLTEQLTTAHSANEDLTAQLSSRDTELTAVKSQININKEQVAAVNLKNDELTSQLSESQSKISEIYFTVDELKANEESLNQTIKSKDAEIETISESNKKTEAVLKKKEAGLKKLESEQKKTKEELNKLKKKLSQRHEASETNHSKEMEAKQEEIEAQTSLIDTYEQEINQLKTQVKAMSGSKDSALSDIQSQLTDSIEHRSTLEMEVEELKLKVEELSSAAVNSDGASIKPADNKTDDQFQINFLNSVIVDQKSKIDQLEYQVAVLAEGGGANGYEDEECEEMDNTFSPARETRPPRLFCDICDVFDAHDTDDCPIQGGGSDSPTPTQHHGQRNEERPYCLTCEVFGHYTEDCDEPDEY